MMAEAKLSRDLTRWFSDEDQVRHLYPKEIQLLTKRHWTPLHITQRVVKFLVPHDNVRVLDIGSGVGKFCLAAGFYKPNASFFGVEQRQHLVSHAETARTILGIRNVRFIHGNLVGLDFNEYDHFYFYNSFYENLMDTEKIDDDIECAPQLYDFYNRKLYQKLQEKNVGTRVATFHTFDGNMPACYQLVEAQMGDLLKFWIKV